VGVGTPGQTTSLWSALAHQSGRSGRPLGLLNCTRTLRPTISGPGSTTRTPAFPCDGATQDCFRQGLPGWTTPPSWRELNQVAPSDAPHCRSPCSTAFRELVAAGTFPQ